MRIERIEGSLVLVEGRAPSTAYWRWHEDRIEVGSRNGKVHVVSPGDVPTDIAIGLLALRDAQRYPATDAAESLSAFALRTWLDSLRDPLLAGRMGAQEGGPSWTVYRFAFFAAASLSSGREGLDPHREPNAIPEGQDHSA